MRRRVNRALGALLVAALAPCAAPAQPSPPPEPPASTIGSPAAFGGAVRAEERVAVPAGSPLRERPHPRAAAVTTVDADIELPLVERRGGWARVRYGARKGWVLLDRSQGDVTEGARGPGQVDRDLLARAVSHLGKGGEAGEAAGDAVSASKLGPWGLRTDLDPSARRHLVGFLDRIAAQVPALYRERYGIEPAHVSDSEGDGGVGTETVVLFAREADYRAFASVDAALVGLDEGGFAGFGLAALYAEGREREELAALLVHELTHLIDARRLGPDTPPWLEEGLANDLGYAQIGPGGALDPTGLGGGEVVRGRTRRDEVSTREGEVLELTVSTHGARAALERLLGALRRGELPPLAELTALEWREMTDPAVRDLAYAESAFFVRFLLDPAGEGAGDTEHDGRAERFRAYLRSIAAGGPAGGDALLAALGEDWGTLEPVFHRWVATHER